MASSPSTSPPISSPPSSNTIFTQLESYNWSHDPDFQHGLSSILVSATSPDQIAELTLRARAFYFERMFNTPVDIEGYKDWRKRQEPERLAPLSAQAIQSQSPNGSNNVEGAHSSNGETADASGLEPQYPTSFQDIIELIQSGKPIPGIRDIPDTVLVDQGTRAREGKRQKPWEKNATPASS